MTVTITLRYPFTKWVRLAEEGKMPAERAKATLLAAILEPELEVVEQAAYDLMFYGCSFIKHAPGGSSRIAPEDWWA